METNDLKVLIWSFRAGDMNAFPPIYSQFEKLIHFFGRKLLREDAVQELTVFLLELLWKLNGELCAFKNSEGLKRYIAVCIRNQYIALSKEEQKQKLELELFENMPYKTALFDDFSDFMMMDSLSCLTPKQNEIIILKYVYKYTDFEIARRLKITRQAVNRLKNRAISTLKKYYLEEV